MAACAPLLFSGAEAEALIYCEVSPGSFSLQAYTELLEWRKWLTTTVTFSWMIITRASARTMIKVVSSFFSAMSSVASHLRLVTVSFLQRIKSAVGRLNDKMMQNDTVKLYTYAPSHTWMMQLAQ